MTLGIHCSYQVCFHCNLRNKLFKFIVNLASSLFFHIQKGCINLGDPGMFSHMSDVKVVERYVIVGGAWNSKRSEGAKQLTTCRLYLAGRERLPYSPSV